MKCNIYCNEREEISINDINTFNVHSEVPGKIFYKSIRVNGTLYEAKDLIARRNCNNYTIQLKDGRYAEINKLYQEEYGGWKMLSAIIIGGERVEMVIMKLEELQCQCIVIEVDDKVYPQPLLATSSMLLK